MDSHSTTSRRPSSDASSSVSLYSGVSVTSTFRHANPQWLPPTPKDDDQPVLLNDSSHTPRTRGSVGILIVGLGGANGTTLLAGVLANRHAVDWKGPHGEPMTPNYNGCITQIPSKGKAGGGGYKHRVKGLADASMAAVGGWVRKQNRTQNFSVCDFHEKKK